MSEKPYTDEMRAAVAAWFLEEEQQADLRSVREDEQRSGFHSEYDAVLASMGYRIRERFPMANEDMLDSEVYHFLNPND